MRAPLGKQAVQIQASGSVHAISKAFPHPCCFVFMIYIYSCGDLQNGLSVHCHDQGRTGNITAVCTYLSAIILFL